MAAIGGLGDQAAFGTRTSTFLTKVTYLIGAAFIVATVFLFKLSIPTRGISTMITQEAPESQHTHNHTPHEHGDVPHTAGNAGDTSAVGMQNVAEEAPMRPGCLWYKNKYLFNQSYLSHRRCVYCCYGLFV